MSTQAQIQAAIVTELVGAGFTESPTAFSATLIPEHGATDAASGGWVIVRPTGPEMGHDGSPTPADAVAFDVMVLHKISQKPNTAIQDMLTRVATLRATLNGSTVARYGSPIVGGPEYDYADDGHHVIVTVPLVMWHGRP